MSTTAEPKVELGGDAGPSPLVETEPSPNYCGDEAPTSELRWPLAPAKAPPATMTVPELADRWGVNVKTIYGMIERKELAVMRVGRLLRIPSKVVESYEQASAVPGGR
jgi:excisionase family DNA binding protein